MRQRRSWRWIALLLSLSLVAAACGDDDSVEVGDEVGDAVDEVTEEVDDAVDEADDELDDAVDEADDELDEMDDDDTDEGAAGDMDMSELGDPDGDGVYVGTAGFELDTNECPGDWDNMEGITEDSIKIGQSLPQSGPLAGFGLLATGMESYFDHINETNGGVGGYTIDLAVRDDGYEAARTVENVEELVASENVAALVTVLGTPNNLAIIDDMNEDCIPQLLNGTGAPNWGDPITYPWTTGMQIDYATEAALWGEHLQTEFPDGATVALITYNNDFGAAYDRGFRAAIDGSDIEIVAQEFHDPTAPNLINEVTTLASTDADVFLIQTTGQFCTQAMDEVAKASWDPLVMMSATCASISQFFEPLTPPAGEGVRIVASVKDVNDPAYADDEFVQFYQETLESQDLDPAQTTYATGWVFAIFFEEIMEIATQLPGGVNRANLVIANRMLDVEHPLLLDGIESRLSGLEDAYTIEAGEVQEFVRNDAGEGGYSPVGDLISLEGEVGVYGESGLAEEYAG